MSGNDGYISTSAGWMWHMRALDTTSHIRTVLYAMMYTME